MPKVKWPAVFPDSRGNKLERYRFLRTKPVGDDAMYWWLVAAAAEEVAEALLAALPEPVMQADTSKTIDGRWSHEWRFGAPTAPSAEGEQVEQVCDLLSQVLTLTRSPELDHAIAGDFYKIPPDEEAGRGWENTEFGELVHRAKYYSDPEQTQAGVELCDRLADIVRGHPLLRRATKVVVTPSTKTGTSERMGNGLARRLGLETITATKVGGSMGEAKAGRSTYELDTYEIHGDALSEHVLIVDDVYKSGVTMRSIAQALKDKEPLSIMGIVGARTMTAR